MNTKETVDNLQLMASTIEELEINNIISCEIVAYEDMRCHLHHLKLTPNQGIWVERHNFAYPWEKNFYYNNIRFYAIYSQEEYDKEQNETIHRTAK